MASTTAYAEAGVDVARSEAVVERLRERLTGSGDLLGSLGGFGAALPIPSGYREPVIVTATDGVGTKTELCRRLDRHDTIGRDLVAMCADDIVCHGATPAWFLDYLAVGRVDAARIVSIVGGIDGACREIGCELVGGETAEHPGVMGPDAFDLAGFCIGFVERSALIDGQRTEPGDIVIGIASSGLHANGYSLVRSVIDRERIDLAMPLSELARDRLGDADAGNGTGAGDVTVGQALLEPTHIYAAAVLRELAALADMGLRVGGLAHITGGGSPGNLPRAVRPDLGVIVDPGSWPEPLVCRLFGTLAGMDGAQRRSTFNAGIGMALIVEPQAARHVIDALAQPFGGAWEIGRVVPASTVGSSRYAEGAIG